MIAYPKIAHVGHREFSVMSSSQVDIEEKVDGSQISFGVIDGNIFVWSKSQEVDLQKPGMFTKAVATVTSLQPLLRDGYTYRGEYVQNPRHNVLVYDRAPEKFIILFDVMDSDGRYLNGDMKTIEASRIGLELVPLLYKGAYRRDILEGLLEQRSILGGQKVEGVVVKPHDRSIIGKYVSPAFKELMTGKKSTPRPPREAIIDSLVAELATDARWQKAVIHLRERGELTETKRDIGPLMKEAGKDMHDETAAYVRERLFSWAWPQISKAALRSLPDWYSRQLETEVELVEVTA